MACFIFLAHYTPVAWQDKIQVLVSDNKEILAKIQYFSAGRVLCEHCSPTPLPSFQAEYAPSLCSQTSQIFQSLSPGQVRYFNPFLLGIDSSTGVWWRSGAYSIAPQTTANLQLVCEQSNRFCEIDRKFPLQTVEAHF